MKVAIIKYNAGNIFSVQCALKRIGVEAQLTDNKDELLSADKVIFPGVGQAFSAMEYLKAHNLDLLIKELSQPVLGICIGMQLMCKHSEEGDTDCLGIFDTEIKKFDNSLNTELKIPHMGWNTIKVVKENNLVTDDLDNKYAYFVHSYYAPKNENTIASCDYITEFSAAMRKNNFYATQFHPEKSGSVGESILRNFIEL